MTVFTKIYPTAIAATAVLALGLYGCGGGGGLVTGPDRDEKPLMPENVDLSDVTPGYMAGADTLEIDAGQSVVHGDVEFTCAAGGDDCTVTIAADGTATSTGGMVTAMNSAAYTARITPMAVDLAPVTAGFTAGAGTVQVPAGQSVVHGDVKFTCAAGGPDCEVVVAVDANGAVSATSTGGTVTAMNSAAYTARITPMAVDLAPVTAGFTAGAGTVQVPAGQSVVHGDVEFSCAAGGPDCTVEVEVDMNGAVSATSTGGMVTAMNSAAYTARITPMAVDLAPVTAGFAAGAGTVQVPAGQSVVHGDVEFSCAAGGADCVVMVMVDSNGAVSATSTGGTVTAMNSDAYDMRITTLAMNKADRIHEATRADRVRSGEPLFARGSGTSASHYSGVVQSYTDGSQYAVALPWHDDQGELNFSISLGSGLPQEELDPLAWLGRSVYTSSSPGTTINEDMQHGLGSDWRAFEIEKEYAGAGALTVNIATDASAAHGLDRPWAGYGEFDSEIALSDVPTLPAGQDWQGVYIEHPLDGSTYLAGSLDGVPGRFTCAVSNSSCYLEISRGAENTGYYPGLSDVIFTPDDPNLSATTLPPATSVDRLPPANYLVFGSWLYVPEDITSSDDYDFGVLAGGGDPYSSDIHNLVGSASYAGSASGMYFTGRSSMSPRVDSFEADVTLTADFDSAELGGRVENFRFNGAATGFPSELQLDSEPIGLYSDVVGEVTDGQPTSSWTGEWQAAFYGNGASPTDHPTGVAGTFGASNDVDGLVGAFGAHKQ